MNLKILLVDDEPVIRKGIRSTMDMDSERFCVVGECSNGAEALNLVETLLPDIIISDIRMPVKDGLELSADVNRLWPEIVFIMLTGYDRFEYARGAIKNKVSHFLLKPVGSEELLEVLKSVHHDITIKKAKDCEDRFRKRLVEDKLTLLQRDFMLSLLSIDNPVSESDLLSVGTSLHISLPGPGYQVYILETGLTYSLLRAYIDQDSVILGSHIGVCSISANKYVLIRNRDDSSMGSLPFCRRIQDQLSLQHGELPTISFSETVSHISQMGNAFKDANEALNNKMYAGRGSILPSVAKDRYTSQRKTKYPDSADIAHDIINSIRLLRFTSLADNIHILFDSFRSSEIERSQIRNILVLILNEMVITSKEVHADAFMDPLEEYNPLEAVDSKDTLEEWRIHLDSKIKEFRDAVQRSSDRSYSRITNDAIEYVAESYSEDISIQKLADKLRITPNYLSRIFKKDTGENFVSFLNRTRIDIAANLLKETNLKIYEITGQVGFNDYKYFAYQFKKLKGLSPGNYRRTPLAGKPTL